MEMRRQDRLASREEALEYLRSAEVGYLSLSDDNAPYTVPLNFVLMGNSLYFHCAHVGRKLDILRKNPQCCFVVSFLDGIKPGDNACDYGAFFRSAIVMGTARWVEDQEEKISSLNALTAKHAERAFMPVNEQTAASVTVIAVDIVSLSGKARKR
jgi:nitroimidazol reductase NimA-like FMN-containing flavoprotein (pyridoxamine 5'-phosphate oxidase superfamily)